MVWSSTHIGFLLLLVFIISLFKLPRLFAGSLGEWKVSNKIKSFKRRNREYQLFNDIILITPDGTTQIDHILISPYGIFVIETKNFSGWIFGDAHQKQWTQILYRNKFHFKNPLHQNYKHIKAIQSFLGVDEKAIFSIVVFVGNSKFKAAMPNNVVKLRDLLPYLQSFTEQILSNKNVEMFSQKLREYIEQSQINQADHIRNIKRNLSQPVCPKCGKQMVLRTARKGLKAGSQFWGCPNFPSCKMVKNLTS